MTSMRFSLPCLALCLVLAACAGRTHAPDSGGPVRVVKTMITGIDQFPDENVMALSTGHGAFVVGPEVSQADKTALAEKLIAARDYVVTIRYVEVEADGDRQAHRRVVAMIIRDESLQLVR